MAVSPQGISLHPGRDLNKATLRLCLGNEHTYVAPGTYWKNWPAHGYFVSPIQTHYKWHRRHSLVSVWVWGSTLAIRQQYTFTTFPASNSNNISRLWSWTGTAWILTQVRPYIRSTCHPASQGGQSVTILGLGRKTIHKNSVGCGTFVQTAVQNYGIGLKLLDISGKSGLGVSSASESTKQLCLIFDNLNLTFYNYVWQYLAPADLGTKKSTV